MATKGCVSVDMSHTYPRCYLNMGCKEEATDLMWDILYPTEVEELRAGLCTYRFVPGLTAGPGFAVVPGDAEAVGAACCQHAKCAGWTTGGHLQPDWPPAQLTSDGGGAWVLYETGDGIWSTAWRSRPLEDVLDLDIPELSPEVYVPHVTSLRYAPIALLDDCPECHVTLKLCFCDSSLWPTCNDPAAYSVEVSKLSWTGAGCFLDEEHTVPSCTRNDIGDLVCT
jgi:hypothetical protein